MPGAIIALDQDRPSGSSPGTPGVARNDGWTGQTVRPRSTQLGNVNQVWTLLTVPPGSTAFVTNPDNVVCAFTPDLPGTYRVQLITNGGGTGNVQILVIRCRFDSTGSLVNQGLVMPGFGETSPESNYIGNEDGWGEPLDELLAYVLTLTGGGGGGASVDDNARAARARTAGGMRAIGVTTALTPAAMVTEITGLGRIASWVSGPSTTNALALGFADGSFAFVDALTQVQFGTGTVTGGGPLHVYVTGGRTVFVGATSAKIIEAGGVASPISITSPSNFGGYAVTVPGASNTEILLITSPVDNSIYYYNLTSGGAVTLSYAGPFGSSPTGICVDNEGAIWICFTYGGSSSSATLTKFTCDSAGILHPAGVSVTGFLCETNVIFDGRYIWGVYSNGTSAILQKVRVSDHTSFSAVLTTNCTARASVLWDGELIVVSTTNALIKVHPDTFEQKVTQAVASADLGALVLSPDGRAAFYSSMVSSTPHFSKYKNPRAEELDRLSVTSIAANKLLFTNSTGEVAALPGGTNGQIVTLVSGVPTWAAPPVSFTAGQDLSGTATAQTVIGLYGVPLDASSMPGASDGDFIQKLSGKWSAITAAALTAALVVADFPPGTNGQILTTVLGATAWAPPPSGFTAGGDLTGTSTSQTVVSISGTSPVLIENASVLEWADSVANPTFTQATRTTDNPPQNLEIHAQYPWVSATGSNRLPGTVTLTLSDPYFLLAGGFLIQYGSTPLIRMGEYVGNGADSGVIWFKDGGAPSTSNWNIRGTASALELNAPLGGSMIFEVGGTGTVWLEINASGVILPQLAGSGSGFATINNSGVIGFGAASSFPPGTAGQIFVTNGTPASTWTSLISYETTHGRFTSGGGGSDYKAILGPTVTEETSTASLWLLPNATAPILTNVSLRSDGANLYVNAQSGNIYFYQGLSQPVMQLVTGSYMGLQDLPSILWPSSIAAPNITQFAAASDVAPQNLYLVPQAPYASAVTNLTGGDFIVSTANSVGAGIKYGGLQLQYDNVVAIRAGVYYGTAGSFNFGAIWFCDAGSPTTANWGFLGNQSSTQFNSPGGSAGEMYFSIASVPYVTIGGATATNPGLSIGINYNSPDIVFDFSHTATQHFTVNATSATITYDAQTANLVAPAALKIQGQYAWASATLANRTPGNLIFDIGAPTNGGTTEAAIQFTRNGSTIAQLSYTSTENFLWLGSAAGYTSSNPVLSSDASTFAYMNVPNGTSAWGVTSSNSTFLLYVPTAQNQLYLGASGAAAPIQLNWSTATAPLIQSGTSATSLTVGTNNPSATLGLYTGANLKAVQFDNPTNQIRGTWYDNTGAAQLTTYIDSAAQTVNWQVASNWTANFYVFGTAAQWTFTSSSYSIGAAAWWFSLLQGGAGFGTSNAGTASPIYLDWGAHAGTTTTPIISSGTAATSLTIQTANTTTATTLNFSMAAATADIPTGNITLAPQAPWASAVTNTNGGSAIFAFSRVASANVDPLLSIQTNNAHMVDLGGYNSSTYAAIWFMQATPGLTNFSFLSDGVSTFFNAPSGSGNLYFGLGTSYQMALLASPSGVTFGGITTTTSNYVFNFAGSGAQTLDFYAGVTSQTLRILARTTDNSTANLIVRAQYAYASATGTNRTPGSVVLDYGAPTNGGTAEGFVQFTRNGSTVAQVGVYAGAPTQADFWLGTTSAFTTTNPILTSDGNTYAYMNVPTGSAAWAVVAGNASFLLYIPATQNVMYLGGASGAAPLQFNWVTAASIIQSGTSATSLTVGTNKNAASLFLQGDSGVTCITLTGQSSSTAGTGYTKITGGLYGTWRDSSGSFTLDTTTTDFWIHVTATQSITMIAPAKGRWWPVLIDASGGSAITLTLLQYASESINGVAGSLVLTFPAHSINTLWLTSDGTNYFFA